MPNNFQNVSALLAEQAQKFPTKIACVLENSSSVNFREINFKEMETATCRNVFRFKALGIKSGDRVATFVRPSLDFVPVIFALFRMGAIPVFIDPGMKLKNMINCIEESKCHAMVGIPLAFVLKKLFSTYFKNIKINICLSQNKWIPKLLRAHRLLKTNKTQLMQPSPEDSSVLEVSKDQIAAILFTSGSTGIPKGVEVSYGILWRQQKTLRESFGIEEDEIDLVVFPLFALFSAAWGITSIIPNMNPARPAKCSGKNLFNIMIKHKVTHTSGSPAIWNNVLKFALKNYKTFPKLKRVLMAGAPVSGELIRGWNSILDIGHVYTPYGATEALPLTFIRDDELLNDCLNKTSQGHGTCVGRPLENVTIKTIPISDQAIGNINETFFLPQGQIGEIIVQGEVVTRSYFGKKEANQMAKITDSESNSFWHRMGDLGYFDPQGRLWFCGRKDHRVSMESGIEIYPVQLEPLFNGIKGIRRTALVGIDNSPGSAEGNTEKNAVLVVEAPHSLQRKRISKDLLQVAASNVATQSIKHIMFVKSFPTDVRHNIKINRSELAQKAQKQLRGKP